MSYPLHVAFIWHMHQPYYRNLETGELSLPWVRLHATKDYLHMVELLREFPDVHVTFNLVPSLVEQLELYADGEADDRWQVIGRRAGWTREEQAFLLSYFFHISWDRVIKRYPGYRRLLALRQAASDRPEYFSEQYYRDLVAWFNLAWIDPNWLERDPALRSLVEKGEHFTAEDAACIEAKALEMIRRVLPTYRELAEKGQIEISTSPYYHPILPLLMDTSFAGRASPGLPLPSPAFRHPEDAEEQIRRAVEFHTSRFGTPPKGIWPPEGAVCAELLPMLRRHGLRWFASDEAILARSLGVHIERDAHGNITVPDTLYQPYAAGPDPDAPAVLFRDRELSDRIGFVYQHMDAKGAVDDLLFRLYLIRDKVIGLDRPYLVAIILDGENAWEEYERNGDLFLRRLYQRLSDEREYLRAVTVSEYLEEFEVRRSLPTLATGSWISGNLETWIGEPAQNMAWTYLRRAREDLADWLDAHAETPPAKAARAWQALYIAEGSDWFWWYYSRNNPAGDHFFDAIFRDHLRGVYAALDIPAPAWLEVPIEVRPEQVGRLRLPVGAISPSLEAAEKASPAWDAAGFLELAPAGGSMQRGAPSPLKALYFGGGQGQLFLRLECPAELGKGEINIYLAPLDRNSKDLPNGRPRHLSEEHLRARRWPALTAELRLDAERAELFRLSPAGEWAPVEEPPLFAHKGTVWEMAIPYKTLGVEPDSMLELRVVYYEEDTALEMGGVRFSLPGEAQPVPQSMHQISGQ